MNKIATSKNGLTVYADATKGHLATHLADDDILLGLVAKVIQATDIDDTNLAFEHVFDTVIGECDLQTVEANDEVLYAVRSGRDRYTKFVKHKARHRCSSVTIILQSIEEGYELRSAWIGHLVPSFPKMNSSPGQDAEEKEYWKTHGLVWGKQKVDNETLTTDCPWGDN